MIEGLATHNNDTPPALGVMPLVTPRCHRRLWWISSVTAQRTLAKFNYRFYSVGVSPPLAIAHCCPCGDIDGCQSATERQSRSKVAADNPDCQRQSMSIRPHGGSHKTRRLVRLRILWHLPTRGAASIS